MKMMLALSMPFLVTTVLAIGAPDASDIKRWLLRCLLLTAGLLAGTIALRLAAERRNRQSLLDSVEGLRQEGRAVSSVELAQATAIPEEGVQLHLPAVALAVGARTVWYEEGGGRHQRLEWPAPGRRPGASRG